MPFEKGQSGNPTGRPRGAQNKSTTAMREAMTLLIENNLDKMDAWLERIAEEDPKAAFQCMMGLMEFHLPKCSRVQFQHEKAEEENKPQKSIFEEPAYQEILRAIKEGDSDENLELHDKITQ